MYRAAQKLSRFLSAFFATGAGLAMLAVFLIVFVNSVRRYGFEKSFEWGEELPVYLAIYGVMFGIAWGYLEDRHVRFTLLVGFLSQRATHYLYIAADLIVTVCGVTMAYSGVLFAATRGRIDASGLVNLSRDLHDLLGWDWLLALGKLYPWQYSMALGGGMLAIAALLKLLLRLSGENKPDPLAEV